MLNYGSYLVEDTAVGGGQITIFMPDGAQRRFTPNGSGGYNNEVGIHDTLRKLGHNQFELIYPTGDKLIYGIPAGTDSLQPFLVEVRDRWGFSLRMGYESAGTNIRLRSITDAQNKVTLLSYHPTGYIIRVDDPFGRHATFNYDAYGNMKEVVDMEGNAFQYTYDADILVTQLNTAQGPWYFKTEMPYRDTNWLQKNIIITDPLGQTEKYLWDATPGTPMQHFDKRNNKTEYHLNQVLDGKAKVTKIVYPSGDFQSMSYDPLTGQPTVVTHPGNRVTQTGYNAMGEVTTFIDAKQQTTRLRYDPANGIDLLSTVNALGQTVATYQYNDKHQPTLITDVLNNQTAIGYTAWGAVASIATSANNQTTNYNYNASHQLSSITRGATTLASFTYDAQGRTRTSTDDAGVTVAYDYNDLDKMTKVTYPDNTYEQVDYTCCGLPGMTIDRAGRKTFYDYDELKRLKRVQDAESNSVDYDYDAAGNLEQLTDSRGIATRWQYDNLGRVSKKSYADGSFDSYSYDVINSVVARQDAQGKVTRSYFDDNDNLTRIDYPGMADVTIGYDALDRPVVMTDGTGSTRYGYDVLSRLSGVDGPFVDDTVTYHYDGLSRRDWMKIDNRDQVSYFYDALDRLDDITSPAGTFDYRYVGSSDLLDQLWLPNNTYATFGYDSPLKRFKLVHNRTSAGANISRYEYGLDQRDVRTFVEQQVGLDPLQRVNFTYDNINQLKLEKSTETPTPALDISYSYDRMGNRTQSQGNGMLWNYNTNLLNQHTSITETTLATSVSTTTNLSYDVKGNVTSQGNGTGGSTYTYDEANRLVGLLSIDPQTGVNVHKSEFVYDGLSRKRIAREYNWQTGTNSWSAPTETRYIYDGMDVIQERDGSNAVKATYTRDGNIGGILSRTVKGTGGGADAHYYYHYDGSGNVTQLTNAAQQTVATYYYDAFGNTTANGPQSGQPYRYSTKAQHAYSGLYDYGFRFYSPGLGRWINRDPIEEEGGLNLYGFIDNDPGNKPDSYGLLSDARSIAMMEQVNASMEQARYNSMPWYGKLWHNVKPYSLDIALAVMSIRVGDHEVSIGQTVLLKHGCQGQVRLAGGGCGWIQKISIIMFE